MNSKKKSSKYWDRIVPAEDTAKKHLKKAEEDLETSRILFSREDYDWSFSIAYNSILQAAKALMAFNKVRSKGPSHHISTIIFLKENYENEIGEEFLYMIDKFRKKRHHAVYDVGEIISEKECETCIKVCEDFIEKIKRILKNEK